MTYLETQAYLFSQLPMFHRIGAAAYKPGMGNIAELLELCGNPHRRLKTIHVAGTNGKGSTSHLIASVLQEAGYKTGLFTSPHLKDFRERIRINGEMIPEDDVIAFVSSYKEQWEKIQPSFFEITVALGFWYFEKNALDISVIETGLGGRLDSTNIITPEVSVITNIGFDHMDFLGDTIEKIAGEKAGIIKPGVPVVLGKMRPDAHVVMRARATSQKSAITDASLIDVTTIPVSDLQGIYQEENRQTAFATLQLLAGSGLRITDPDIKNGFRKVVLNTRLQGRWQILNQHPLIIADVAHNEDGMKNVMRQLDELEFDMLHFVLGMVRDKDVDRVLRLLPPAKYYFCKASIPRAMPVEELEQKAAKFGLFGNRYESVIQAFDAAKSSATENDCILVSGSVFTVGEII